MAIYSSNKVVLSPDEIRAKEFKRFINKIYSEPINFFMVDLGDVAEPASPLVGLFMLKN